MLKLVTAKSFAILALCGATIIAAFSAQAAEKSLVYLAAGIEAPFWRYVSKGA